MYLPGPKPKKESDTDLFTLGSITSKNWVHLNKYAATGPC